MKKKLFLIILSALLVFSLAACAKTAPEPVRPDQEGSEEDGQNPIMNFVGDYGYGRTLIHVEADGMEKAKFSVTQDSSLTENMTWTMTGSLDDKLTVVYDDAVKKTVKKDADGNVLSEEVEYEKGTGQFVFDPSSDVLRWHDDVEQFGDGVDFIYGFVLDPLATGDEFEGIWESDRVTLEIKRDGEDFSCIVGWPDGAKERTVWTYTCYFDGNDLVSNETGVKSVIRWDENDNDSEEILFEDGAAVFSIGEDGKLTWQDFKEDAGKDLVFDYAGPLPVE